MTSGFRKVELSQMRTVLVAQGMGVLNSVRAEGLKTLYVGLLPHSWSLPFSRERGMGVERHAPSPNVRRLRGDFHVWRSQILCFREVTYQGQCWVQLLNPELVSHTQRGTSPTAWTHRYKETPNTYSRMIMQRPCAKHLVLTLSLNHHQPINIERWILKPFYR